MRKIFSAISCNLDENILSAALPLFENEKVDALEWSFDTLYKKENIPEWFVELLHAFGNKKRLIGHGVYFSLFSGSWSPGQQKWLAHLEKISASFQFDHITGHFGFMTGENFHHGAPISIPFTSTTLAIGRDRLKRIYNSCKCPVGIENLAFAYSPDEIKRHGVFLDELVSPINGFIILDLHNLYCQSQNFKIPLEEMIQLYPLHRVREIHISGGSWEDSIVAPGRKVRRDTHDDKVPEEVFGLLEMAIGNCPQLKYVVLEQLSNALTTEEMRSQYRLDFIKMNVIINNESSRKYKVELNSFIPPELIIPEQPLEDIVLQKEQFELSNILESAASYKSAVEMLQSSVLSGTAWKTEQWEPCMLETAIAIAQKWKNGFQ